MIRFLAHMLLLLAVWTLIIKYAFPLAYDWKYEIDTGTHIMWDFWWVVHLWLAFSLLSWKPYTYWLAVITSVVEILIIVVKFALFLNAPDWTLWQSNWFINKLFVLACFVVMLTYFLINRKSLLARS